MNLDLGDTRFIIEYARRKGVLRNQLAYILATAYHETAHTMKPIKETVMVHHKDKNPSDATVINRLNTAFSKGQLKWVKTPYWRDGWFGRGYVQLTHKANYDKMGVTKVTALKKEDATSVLVDGMLTGAFTGKKLGDFVTIKVSDFYNARKVVNGMDQARLIEGYAKKYDAMLLEDGYGVDKEPEKVNDKLPKTRIWTWVTASALPALGLLDWRVQLLSVAIVGGLAVYAIITIPQIKDWFK